MIEFTKAFRSSDGATHATLDEAKRHELTCLFMAEPAAHTGEVIERIVSTLHRESDRIVDILTTTANSKPRARKVNGGTKTRKSKPASPAPATPQ